MQDEFCSQTENIKAEKKLATKEKKKEKNTAVANINCELLKIE